MFNLPNVKVVFFDFDNTLCVHTTYVNHDKDYRKEYGTDHYRRIKAYKSEIMQEFLDLLIENDVELCLTSATYEYCFDVKQQWLKEQYGYDFKNYCVTRDADKTTTICNYALEYDIDLKDILFVDDKADNLITATAMDIPSCHPLEIAEFIYRRSGDGRV